MTALASSAAVRGRIGVAIAGAALVGGLVLALVGGAGIGLGDGDRSEHLFTVGLPLAVVAFLVLLGLRRTVASPLGLVAGALIAAEGFAMGWLGHMGGLEVVPGLVLLLAAVAAASGGSRRRLLLLLAALAATGLLAAAFGVGGQYLTFATNPGGGDCLAGWAGDPSQYPAAASQPGAITTSFSWSPLGRACSFVDAGRTTTLVQTSAVTTAWILGLAVAGLVLALAATVLRRVRPAAR